MIKYHLGNGLFWIRFTFLGNRGFYIKDIRKVNLTFSERSKNVFGFYVFNYYVGFLKK